MLCDQEQCCCKCRLCIACNYFRNVSLNFLASNFAHHAIALTHLRAERHRANTTSRNASSHKKPLHLRKLRSHHTLTLLAVTQTLWKTTAEHQLVILVMAYLLKLHMHFNNRPYLYSTRCRAVTQHTNWIEITRARRRVLWQRDDDMSEVTLMHRHVVWQRNACCAKLFCCTHVKSYVSATASCKRELFLNAFAMTSSGNHMWDFSR